MKVILIYKLIFNILKANLVNSTIMEAIFLFELPIRYSIENGSNNPIFLSNLYILLCFTFNKGHAQKIDTLS